MPVLGGAWPAWQEVFLCGWGRCHPPHSCSSLLPPSAPHSQAPCWLLRWPCSPSFSPPLTPLLPLFSFIHPVPFLFLEEREMLGELRYLAGIRCELGKTALALAPVLSPLYRPSRCRPPGAGPQLQAPRHRPQAQAPRRRPPGAGWHVQAPQVWVSRCGAPWCRLSRSRPWAMLPHASRKCLDLCVQSPVGDWAASTWGWDEEWHAGLKGSGSLGSTLSPPSELWAL